MIATISQAARKPNKPIELRPMDRFCDFRQETSTRNHLRSPGNQRLQRTNQNADPGLFPVQNMRQTESDDSP
jgi:hypothetical protein